MANKYDESKIETLSKRLGVPKDFVESSLSIRYAESMIEKLEGFEREKDIITAGDSKSVERHHKEGKLTARERIAKLVDPGSFEELELWQKPYETGFDIGEETGQGDGVSSGYGSIDKKPVTIWAQDATVMGGTVGTVHARKIAMMMEAALDNRTPIIGMFDSEGVRAHDAIQFPDFYSPSIMAYFQTLSSGVIPKISLVMGKCIGEMALIAGLGDFVFMVKNTSDMHITRSSSKVDESLQANVGSCDIIADDDEDCLIKCKELLSYLPSNNTEAPPFIDTGDDPDRREEELLHIVPANSRKAFNMRNVINLIVDNGVFFEIRKQFARNLITGFTRLGGYSVGIIASNPQFLGGCMNLDAADKMSRFVRFCDAFNLPLIWLADTPAFLPSIDEETRGLIRHGSRMIMANSEATVPRITVSLRKHFGGGRLAMPGSSLASDVAVGWPTFEPGLMGAKGAVSILYRKELKAISDEQLREEQENKRIEEMQFSLDMHMREGAQKIIDPRETRPFLIRALSWLKNREQKLPEKKHENIRL